MTKCSVNNCNTTSSTKVSIETDIVKKQIENKTKFGLFLLSDNKSKSVVTSYSTDEKTANYRFCSEHFKEASNLVHQSQSSEELVIET
jgi:hypothetical protein